ncbi:MAG: replicative DNA helicase, partial [Gemmatimonadales bacterium]
VERIEARHRGDSDARGVLAGFKDLDLKTNGFQKSDLIVVAARPAMGKTSFCLNVVASAALEHAVPVALFSLEMSEEQLSERLLASESWVELHRLRSGNLRDEDFPKMSQAVGRLSAAPIWIDDTPAITTFELRSKARRMKAEHDIGLIVIDYLQLLRDGESRDRSRNEEISNISRSLKALARELEVPVIALSQLSRAPEQRGGDKRPLLSDLRDSGAIEQDADLVLFIYRAEMYRDRGGDDAQDDLGIAELILAKHRNGPTGTIKAVFRKEFTRFEDYTERTPPPSAF